ncbi:hypothetical protein GGI22_001766, partial [Coemansia erecta]
MACRACRLRKIRCGGERPRCTYCVKKGYECVLTPHKKRGRPRKNSNRGNKQGEPRLGGSDTDDIPLATAVNHRNENVAANRATYDESSGMRAMRIPVTDEEQEEEGDEEPLGDTLLDGLDIDVRQLWAELTGLQGLDLPPELSALAANSAIQPIDAYPSSIPSIGPSFNLGMSQPPLSIFAQANGSFGETVQMNHHRQQQQIVPHQMLPLHSSADAGLYGASSLAGRGTMADLSAANMGGMDMFASNYAFPRQADEGPGSASPLTTPRPQPELQHQQQQKSLRSEGSASKPRTAEDNQTGSSVDGHTAAASRQRNPTERARSTSSSGALGAGLPTIRQTVDEGVQMYFIYVHPWLPILHRPTFERQITDGRVDPILYYAVQAVAARFKDRDNTSAFANASGGGKSAQQAKSNQQPSSVRKPYKRGQRYARAARALLPESLRNARLSTLQAITIMALYMSVSGHWQEGAAYERLAVQLAFIGQYHLLDEEFLLPPVTNNMGLYESGWSEHSHPARLE